MHTFFFFYVIVIFSLFIIHVYLFYFSFFNPAFILKSATVRDSYCGQLDT